MVCLLLVGVTRVMGTGVEDPVPIGGQTLTFGRISIAVPDGWFRATPAMEQEYDAYGFIYVMKRDDPEQADAKCVVRIERNVDDFASDEELTRYRAIVESRLTASGWVKGEMQVQGVQSSCYRRVEDDMTTYLIQIESSRSLVTTYTVIPKSEAGYPKVALTFLQAIRIASATE